MIASAHISERKYMELLDEIYERLFQRIKQNTIDIFLCGGISTKKQRSTRDSLKEELQKMPDFRVLYPEDLFMDSINLNKDNNLLTLEQLLAQNCDCICIVCESVGSFVELGAFTNNDKTFPKVLALVKTKYKNDRSFLMLGPIKFIQSVNKNNVIFYNSSFNKSKRAIIHAIRSMRQSSSSKEINTIVGLHHFILLALNFTREFPVGQMVGSLKNILRQKGFFLTGAEYNVLFKSSMKLLYKEKAVERFTQEHEEYYRITPKGLAAGEKLIRTLRLPGNDFLLDGLRLKYLNSLYY